MYRPLQASDFISMFHKLSNPNDPYRDCYMPVREDFTLRDGTVIEGLLAYGSPKAYEFRTVGDKVYCVRSWDENPELGN